MISEITNVVNRALPTSLDGRQGSLFIAGTIVSIVGIWFVNEFFRYRIK